MRRNAQMQRRNGWYNKYDDNKASDTPTKTHSCSTKPKLSDTAKKWVNNEI